MPGAGELDQLISFEAESLAPDSFGGGTVSWSTFASVWAKLTPVRAREDERQGAQRASTSYMIEVWNTSDLDALTAAMRVNWRGTLMNIREIRRPPERALTMTIIAETGVTQ